MQTMAPTSSEGLDVSSGGDREPALPMSDGWLHTRYIPDRKQYVIAFDEPHDPLNPQDWTTGRK